MKLNSESKTLFIPLLGRALVSSDNLFLMDKKAEEIVNKVSFDFKSLKQSKWLSMYMSLRGLIIDELCNKYISNNLNCTVIHLGCGLDSRFLRVNQNYSYWYDVDYKEVIDIRKDFYFDSDKYEMIGSSVLDHKWLDRIKKFDNVLVVAEGLTMYLSEDEIKGLLDEINKRFKNVYLIFDAYSKKGVKLSKIKNPVNQVNAFIKYGFDNIDEFLSLNNNLEYVDTSLIKKDKNNLKRLTKFIFNNLYCGKISQSLYKIYEFKMRE